MLQGFPDSHAPEGQAATLRARFRAATIQQPPLAERFPDAMLWQHSLGQPWVSGKSDCLNLVDVDDGLSSVVADSEHRRSPQGEYRGRSSSAPAGGVMNIKDMRKHEDSLAALPSSRLM
jgi:hypothetical protein